MAWVQESFAQAGFAEAAIIGLPGHPAGVWVAPGKVLVSWDGGMGPTWAYDEGTLELLQTKLYDYAEVYRSTSPTSLGNLIGRTKAEAFLDETVCPNAVYYYTVIAYPDEAQVGPAYNVETMSTRSEQAGGDRMPPSVPTDVSVSASVDGNIIAMKPSADSESGVLAYFVYTDNGAQPESVVWTDSWDTTSSATHDLWTDRAGDDLKGYVLRSIDESLNLSEPTDPAGTDVPLIPFNFWLSIGASHPTDETWSISWTDLTEPHPDHYILWRGKEEDYSDATIRYRIDWYSHSVTFNDTVCPDDYTAPPPYYWRVDGSNEDETELFDVPVTSATKTGDADPVAPLWLTGVMVEPMASGLDPLGDFADGSTAGWEWDGTAGNSTSRETGGTRMNVMRRTQTPFTVGYGPRWSADPDPVDNLAPHDAIALPTDCATSALYGPLHDDHGGDYNVGAIPVDGVYHYWVSCFVAFRGGANITFECDASIVSLDRVSEPVGLEFVRYAGVATFPHDPVIDSFDPVSGPIGTTVTLTGSDFHDVYWIECGGAWMWDTDDPPSFTIDSDTQITFDVPAGASAGESYIAVHTPFGSFQTTAMFTVT